MNWARAKSILIVLFLFVNFVLGIVIYRNFLSNKSDTEEIENSISILEKRGIKIECKIDWNTPKISSFRTDGITYSKNFKYTNKKFSNLRLDGDANELFEIAKKGIDRKIVPVDLFEYGGFKKTERFKEYKYFHKVGKEYIFSNYIKVVEYEGEIDVECSYKKLYKVDSKTTFMQLNRLLLSKFPYTNFKTIITDIKYGHYQRNFKNRNELFFLPVWRVVTSDGQERYFRGNSGEEI